VQHLCPPVAFKPIMNFLFALASLAVAAAAQSIEIGYPSDQSSITHGQNLTVQVNRPVSSILCISAHTDVFHRTP
jgi:hypothetical protein